MVDLIPNSEVIDDIITSTERTTERTDKQKSDLVTRLNRIEGQIRGIKGMIEKDTYCDDVLHQISAVQSALKSVSKLILQNHMNCCVVERIQSGDQRVVDELINTIGKML